MLEDEVYGYEAYKKRMKDDMRVVEGTDGRLFNQKLIQKYIDKVKKERKIFSQKFCDKEILELMGILSHDQFTLSGIMVFLYNPQIYFPQLCIRAVAVAGIQAIESDKDDERFIDNERITGSIPKMLEEAVDFVRRNSRVKTIIDKDDGKRKDKPEYPIIAVREAILNALVHRDYSVYKENVPIRMEMYRDRLEIINSSTLFGTVTRPGIKNPILANILELLEITENRYSGIPMIKKVMKEVGLPAPLFSYQQGEFKVVFKNNIY